ncbi:hypothetical protein pb186bvf_014437 [Paramecium bursaria]
MFYLYIQSRFTKDQLNYLVLITKYTEAIINFIAQESIQSIITNNKSDYQFYFTKKFI